MAANDLEIQPRQDLHMAETELPTDDVLSEEAIIEKSTVYRDPMAPNQSDRFRIGDVVHMAEIEDGIRTKGIFTVAGKRPHSSGCYYEYRLVDADGRSYKNCAWVREKNLAKESERKVGKESS